MLKNEILEVRNTRWLVKEAISKEVAIDAIYSAMVTGSIGETVILNKCFVGGGKEVIADVHQINSDGTLREAYKTAY